MAFSAMPSLFVLALLGAPWDAAAEASAVSTALGAIREAYTTNAICGKKNCINPIFPGMEDLHRLQQASWLCSSLRKTSEHMGFCRNAVSYDPALPIPPGGSASVEELVQRQDKAATTMFYYHLAGMGKDGWDYQKPEFADDCTRSIWRLACFTYFPKAEVGCVDGSYSKYMRPCMSSCKNYVKACGVECCDESVQCVFSHEKELPGGTKVTSEGYAPHDGPSSICTGGARRATATPSIGLWALIAWAAFRAVDTSASSALGGVGQMLRSALGRPRRLIMASSFVVMAMSLQGCDYDVPIHRVGNWRGEQDYLIKYEFIPPGGSPHNSALNSCSMPRLSQTLQCSGRGVCVMWDPANLDNDLAFCNCDTYWADPECSTRRRSQMVAYVLSMFFGYLGLDMFYLGFNGAGIMKLFTFGGFGFWWIYDIIRIGSAPVYASNFRTADDLPHFAFVLSCVMFAVLLGFVIAYNTTVTFRARKRKEAMLLQNDEEARQQEAARPFTESYGPGLNNPVLGPKSAFDSMGPGPMGYGSTGKGMPPTSFGGKGAGGFIGGKGMPPPSMPPPSKGYMPPSAGGPFATGPPGSVPMPPGSMGPMPATQPMPPGSMGPVASTFM